DGHSTLLAGLDRHGLVTEIFIRDIERPVAHEVVFVAAVVDDDQLLLDRLARKKDVVLAREACGLAPNVSQYFLIVADERFRGRRSDPVVVLAIDTHPPLT